MQHDVDAGRSGPNFSEWDRAPQKEAGEAPEAVLEGEMPPRIYTLVHAHARLNAAERNALAEGLARTIGHDSEGMTWHASAR